MFDNGLLEVFENRPFKLGPRKLKQSEFSFRPVINTFNRPILRGTYNGKSYFVKDCANKSAVDAEVLLSQVYARAGFKTAVYLPMSTGVRIDDIDCSPCFATYDLTKNGFSVISNDISQGKNVLSYDEFTQKKLDAQWYECHIFPARRSVTNYEMSGNSTENSRHGISGLFDIDYKDYFTKDGARDFIKMHVFDIATNNFDRRTQNFLVETNDDGKIDGIRLFDFGASSWTHMNLGFYSYLGNIIDVRTRGDVINELKDNDSVMDVMFPYEMADEVRSLDFRGAAKDIEETIGYKIAPDFVSLMEKTSQLLVDDLENFQ